MYYWYTYNIYIYNICDPSMRKEQYGCHKHVFPMFMNQHSKQCDLFSRSRRLRLWWRWLRPGLRRLWLWQLWWLWQRRYLFRSVQLEMEFKALVARTIPKRWHGDIIIFVSVVSIFYMALLHYRSTKTHETTIAASTSHHCKNMNPLAPRIFCVYVWDT